MSRRLRRLIMVNCLIIVLIISVALSWFIEPLWILVMVSAAVAFGAVAPVIAARRLYFLASASPHSALLAVALAIPLSRATHFFDEYFWAIIIGTLLTYIAGYMIYKGVDPDIATAVFVAFTASASVIALYYVLVRFPVEVNVWAYIVGDPLLSTWRDGLLTSIIAAITTIIVVLTFREQIVIGVERDCARLAGVSVRIYDFVLFTMLGIITIAMLRVVGFVLEHVFILLPAAIAIAYAESSSESLLISLLASITASITGLSIAIILGLAPAGVTGLVLFTLFMATLIVKSVHSHGVR